jgi:uncharacterized membrane protein
MSQQNFALDKKNYIIIAIAVVIIILGFVLMTGTSSTTEAFETDIFSVQRIKMAPIVSLLGFILVIIGILFPTKKNLSENIDKK